MSRLSNPAGYATLLLTLGLVGCNDGPSGPSSGAMRVAVVSTGVEIDPDGYTFSVDGGTGQPIASNGAVVLGGLAVGEHTVGLAGLAANCTTSGANPQNVRVTGTDTVTAFFQVACTSTRGTLQITAVTTGTDLDVNGYEVVLQRESSTINVVRVGTNGMMSVPNLPAGSYTANITNVAGNCTLNGPATRTFTIAAGATTQLAIQVTCTAITPILGFPFTDPAGDTLANPRGTGARAIDLLEITGTYKTDSLIMTLRFAAPVRPLGAQAPNSLAGFLEFDTDENTSTGGSPQTNSFGGNASLGVDYIISFFSNDTSVVQIGPISTDAPSSVKAEYSESQVTLRIPLALMGNDDGNFRFAGVFGTRDRPTDVAPNAGVYTARRPGTSAQMAPVRTSSAEPTLSRSVTYRDYVPRSWSERK